MYEKFLLMTNKKSLSSILSLILISLLVIMPSIALLGLIGNELINFINSYEKQSFGAYMQMIPEESLINEMLGSMGLNIAQITEKLDGFFNLCIKIFYQSVSKISANVINFFISLFILYIRTFSS
jgi:hypothetical protein